MKTWRTLPSLNTLASIALGGGILVGSTNIVIEYLFQKKVRETSTYKRTLDIFRSNEKAVKYLGEPIIEGKVKVGNNTDEVRTFTVSLKGSNAKGKLDCEYKIIADCKTEIQKVELKFMDIPDKIYMLHKI